MPGTMVSLRALRPSQGCSRILRRGALLSLGMMWLVVGAESVAAQDFDVTVGLGSFVDYPGPFSGPYCEQNAAGVAVSGAWRALRTLSLDLTAIAAGGTGTTVCALPLFAPIPPDTPYEQRSYGDHIAGTGLFATNLSAVFEPFPTAPLTPRARLGAGVLWNKELGNWLWGLGIRYRFGRHSFVTDVEGWNLKIERTVNTMILRSATGTMEVLSTESQDELSSPFFIKIGWTIEMR